MITITKAIFGMSALASAGALTVVETPLPSRAPVAPIVFNGKAIDRLPSADGKISGEAAMQRIRLAHGINETQTTQGIDCRAFAWPNIPVECIAPASGGQARRAVRVISTDAQPAAAEQLRNVRN